MSSNNTNGGPTGKKEPTPKTAPGDASAKSSSVPRSGSSSTSAATDQPVSTAAPGNQQSQGGSGWFAGIVGGLVGAALGGGGLIYYQNQQGPPPLDPALSERLDQLEADVSGIQVPDVTALEERLGTLEGVSPPDLTSIEDRISALENIEIPSFDEAGSVDLTAVTTRLDELGQEINQAVRQVDEVRTTTEQQITASGEQSLAEVGTLRAATEELVDDLSSRIDGAEATATAGLAAAASNLADRTGDIEWRLSTLSDEIAGQLDELSGAVGGQGEELSTLVASIEDQQQQTSQRFDTIEQEIADVRDHNMRQMAAALAAQQVSASIVEGRPFADALEQLNAVSADDPVLNDSVEALSSYAGDGVPTLAELQQGFDEAVGSLPPPDLGDNSVLGQAASFVNLRRSDEMTGIQTIEDARNQLANGDLQGAVNAIQSLSEERQSAAFADWLNQAQAKLAAMAASEDLTARAQALLREAP